VEVDGAPAYQGRLPPDRRLAFRWSAEQQWVAEAASPPARFGRLEKTRELCGPIEHAFMGPFLLVYGTRSPEARENDTSRKMAEEFAERWQRWSLGPRA